jgi:MFS family permease
MLIAPLSELYGRLVLYYTCNVFYIGFIIGCVLSHNTGMFLIFRFLAGCASLGPLTVGRGTVADVVLPAQRGRAMSLFVVGPLLGPISRINACKCDYTDGNSRSWGQSLAALLLNQLAGDGLFGLL